MATIFINELAIKMHIGVPEWERRVRQTVLVDCEMRTDIQSAASAQDIAQTINYQTVVDELEALAMSKPYVLVESLIEDMADLIEKNFKPSWLSLKVTKPFAIANAAGVGVKIERGTR